MFARVSQILGLTPTKTRQERLDSIGYTNDPPSCFIDPISFMVMSDPYRFNQHNAQVTDWRTIQQYNRQTGRQSNPFFQQNSAIVCEKHSALDTAIELYVTTLEKMHECFTQIEQVLCSNNAEAQSPASPDEKNKRIAIIQQARHALIELLSQFIDQTIPIVLEDSQILTNDEKASALQKLLTGPEMLRELLLHEILHVNTLTESDINARYQASIEFAEYYRTIAFTPLDNDLKSTIAAKISTLSDGKIAAELETIRNSTLAKIHAALAITRRNGLTSSFCLFGMRVPAVTSPRQQPASEQPRSPSLSRQMEAVD